MPRPGDVATSAALGAGASSLLVRQVPSQLLRPTVPPPQAHVMPYNSGLLAGEALVRAGGLCAQLRYCMPASATGSRPAAVVHLGILSRLSMPSKWNDTITAGPMLL